MSGFVAVLETDGRPVAPGLLERLTAGLAFRGPDGSGTWQNENVALGHRLLVTTPESAREQQPSSLDGQMWLVGNVRLDDRTVLRNRLQAPTAATDPELLLHAYRNWGTACLEHLLGDFSFVLWDGPRRRLFAAVDRFRIRPLYYAWVDGTFVASNTMNCVRAHPAVPDDLDEVAVGDCLLVDYFLD